MIRTLITAAISLSVSIYFIVICVNSLGQEFVENDWKTARATILSSETIVNDKKSIQRKNEGIEQVLNYEYEIAGVKYRSNSVAREAIVDLNNYPEGTTLDIYYNPKDRADSLIVRTSVPQHYLYLFIGTCVLVIFVILYCCVRDIKARKK